ncbi:2-amino-4-hydroxy-6-hydroxymethyldihydropteridine diphosphokinase [Martelella mediterranea]|nr:2-amino-4-hydroxy-6-hydroxymethyldihydropteridine diphosphokinase [Martelella mediterranea]
MQKPVWSTVQSDLPTIDVTLGLGGNLGDPRQTMAQALHMLNERPDCRVDGVSRLYRTPPWGLTEQPAFLNSCARLKTSLKPDDLMQLCLDIEHRLKRVRKVRWGPRLVDIDILTYGLQEIESDHITVPHPRMTERGFVLVPLAEIAPDLPVLGRTVADWASKCERDGILPASEDGHWWEEPLI